MNDPTIPQSPALVSYFERLHERFDALVDLPAVERETELARVAVDAPELADDLRALLEHAARSDSPLDSAAVRLGGDDGEPLLPRIAGFRIDRCIGRGGSATVYLADQEHSDFTRKVALKVVDRPFDTDALRSVREEQRILARLEHPGIARLYDSGVTPEGRHWLAMEHVEGESILAHCRSRDLSSRERIELFLPVLDAVGYAHARGIVHRDLKPANIFVTGSGEARLLDFGIAKLTDPTDENETRTLRRALTPAYASPEQMRGGRITAASDIYSLGVVLYELLAGTLPADDTEQRRAVGGDIDAVLNKALRQRPEERYDSVTAFAADLRNVLSGAPVAARRGELGYRVRKLLRRYRAAVATVLIALLLSVAAWQAVRRWLDARPNNEVALYYDAEPAGFETRRLLREGAGKLARFDAAGARDSFRRAAASSKGQAGEALAWDGVSRAESSLGEIGRAAEAARRAGALPAAGLPKHEAERLRARALAANREWNGAIAAFEALFGERPERVDVGLDLVATLLACGRTDAADTALGRLRQLGGGDPRVDLIEADVALQLSEFQRAAAAASRARDGAARAQAVALVQRAARLHADAIGRLDRVDEARRELTAIVARDEALGLAGEAAAARFALSLMMMRRASNDETRRTLEATRAGCARAGNRRCEIGSQSLLAMIDGMEGKLAEAIRAAGVALADARGIGDRWCEGFVLSHLHSLHNWADDPAALEAMEEPLLAALRESGNRRQLLTTLTNLALFETDRLELEKGDARLAEAEGLARRVGSQLASANVDRARGYLEETRGDLDLARKSYTAAVEKARQAGAAWNIGHNLSDLALLEMAANRPGPAAENARGAIAAFTSIGETVLARIPEGILAWSEARQGNAAEARRRLAALRRVSADDGSPTARFTLLEIEAYVAEATGEWSRVIEIRRETLRMAREWNLPAVTIRQQVFLARALRGAGDRRELEPLVAGLLPEVERRGLHGVARELRELLASS